MSESLAVSKNTAHNPMADEECEIAALIKRSRTGSTRAPSIFSGTCPASGLDDLAAIGCPQSVWKRATALFQDPQSGRQQLRFFPRRKTSTSPFESRRGSLSRRIYSTCRIIRSFRAKRGPVELEFLGVSAERHWTRTIELGLHRYF